MNAAKIYNMIMHRNLEKLRPLFASTSVKGNDYPAHYYISELVAPKAINTAPLKTIQAFIKEGDKTPKLPFKDEEIEHFFAMLKANGIDMKSVYYELLQEGLKYIQLVMVSGVVAYVIYLKQLCYAFPAGLLLGGAFSNVYDRFIHGGVVDMFYWHAWPYPMLGQNGFAVFNFADVMIDLAVVWILFLNFKPKFCKI